MSSRLGGCEHGRVEILIRGLEKRGIDVLEIPLGLLGHRRGQLLTYVAIAHTVDKPTFRSITRIYG
jgi:hypothetical protein